MTRWTLGLLIASAVAVAVSMVCPPSAAGPLTPTEARAVLAQFRPGRALPPDLARQTAALIKQLGDPSYVVRERATLELIGLGPQVLPAVRAAAGDPDPEVAIRAERIAESLDARTLDAVAAVNQHVASLAAADDRELPGDLIELLGHANPDVRYQAEYALRQILGGVLAYNAYDADAARRAAAAGARSWWARNKDAFRYAPPPADVAGLLVYVQQKKQLWLVGLDGSVLAELAVGGSLSCAIGLDNGDILLAYRAGPIEQRDPAGKVVWSTRSTNPQLAAMSLQRLPNGNTLIGDAEAERVVELTRDGKTAWELRGQDHPAGIQRLPNGNTLVGGRGYVCEFDRSGRIVWQFDGRSGASLGWVADAVRLPNGNTLICDICCATVSEVDRSGRVVWRYRDPTQCFDWRVVRLGDGSTLVGNDRGVAVIDRQGRKVRMLVDKGASMAAPVSAAMLAHYVRSPTTRPAARSSPQQESGRE